MISEIIHIADIHIRHGDIERSRYNEYHCVLNNFIKSIKELDSVKNGTALTVICGDLFHNKGKIDTPAAKLYFAWMTQLLHLTDVVIICGNHDYKQEDLEHPDMIDVFTSPFNAQHGTHLLYYLKDTGSYTIHNICFGVVSIKDILKTNNTSGSIDYADFPEFPQPSSDDNIINIALFHGCNFPVDWFKGYNIVALGDNHKQTIDKNVQYDYNWGYSGSLIQQDFGEPMSGHGYLLWDLKKYNATPVNIYNPFAMLTIRKINSKFVLINQNEKIDLEEALFEQFFPSEPRIRYIGKINEEIELNTYLNAHQITPKDIYVNSPTILNDGGSGTNNEIDNENITNIINQISDLNNPDKWMDYLNSIGVSDNTIKIWMNNPSAMKINSNNIELSSDIQKRIIDRISKLDNLLDDYNQSLSKTNNVNKCHIVLQNMSWDYVLCYGANNYFDFTKLEGKVALLNGRNASGKSAFLDTLCIGLYGEPSKQRNVQNKKLTGKMIHDHRPKDNSMKVSILFKCGPDENNQSLYEIHRTFGQQDSWARSINASICTVDIDNSTKTVICEGTTLVNDWINKHFGTIDEILMSTIISQVDINNFFYMKSEDQKAILDKSLNLESVGYFAKYLHECILAHKDIIDSVTTIINTIYGITKDKPKTSGVSKQKIENLESEIATKTEILNTKRSELEKLVGIIGANYSPSDINESSISDYDSELKKINKFINSFDMDTSNIETMLIEVAIKENELKTLISQLSDLAKQHTTFESSDASELLEEKLDSYNKQITNIQFELSREVISKKENDYKEWAKKQNADWLTNIDELSNWHSESSENLTDLKTKLSKCDLDTNPKFIKLNTKYTELSNNPVVLSMSENEMSLWSIKYSKWKVSVEEVSSDNSNSSEELKEQIDKYKEYIDNYNTKTEKKQKITKDLEDFQKELKQMEDLPYNHDCWACNKQPMQIRKKQLLGSVVTIQETLAKINKYFNKHTNIQQYHDGLKNIICLYEKRKYYEDTKDIYNETQAKFLESDKVIIQYKKWKTDLKSTEILLDEIKLNIKITKTSLISEIDKLEKEITAIQLFINDSSKYIEMDKLIATEKDKYALYDDLENKIEIINNTIKYKQLKTTITEKQMALDDLKTNTEKYKIYKTHLNNKTELEKKISYIQSRILKKTIKQLDSEVQEYISEYGVAKKLSIDSDDTQEKCNILQEYLEILKIKKEKLLMLESKFIGNATSDDETSYKEWIYKNHVIPLLESEVNKFLEPIDNIRLKILYNGKSMVHMIHDRGNLPTLDMSSGYQKFIIAIALRLALSRIGAVGQNIRHLYMDEGFTACDSFNLEKSNLILRNIMSYGNYHSIVIMSHLDIIRDIADTRINITRGTNDLFSEIKWGTNYPKLIKNKVEGKEVKKKGRPSKIAK